MIKLTRVDDRLLHGQVAFTWIPALGADCILIANDKVARDEFQKMALGLAKPSGAKMHIKSIPDAVAFLQDTKNANLKILIIVNAVQDARALSAGVPAIRSVNFGGLRGKPGARPVSKSVSLTEEEIALIREMLKEGIELEIRQVPTETRQLLETLI
jgi:mannose/fructose/N-acetylgalactosamine-specific phosphotransferase system component IIB